MAASIVIAATVGFTAGQWVRPEAPQPVVIAVLVTDTQVPGAIVEAFANNSIHIIPLEAITVPEGKILEVWTKPNEDIGAVSLGRFLRSMEIILPAASLPMPQGGQLYEITLENAPGSPTGKPTGPILFKGLGQVPI
jgi:anti-sigma-K factor RskA